MRWHFVDGQPPTSLLCKLGVPELADKWPKDVLGMVGLYKFANSVDP